LFEVPVDSNSDASGTGEIEKLKKEIDDAFDSRQSLPKEIEEQSAKLKTELVNLDSITKQAEKASKESAVASSRLEQEKYVEKNREYHS
jgi:septal ring factor EnvC (AmiA/AmiB activator)